MSSRRFSPEFKEEAVRQVTQRGYSVVDVAERVGVSANSLYKWVRAAKAAEPASDELVKTPPGCPQAVGGDENTTGADSGGCHPNRFTSAVSDIRRHGNGTIRLLVAQPQGQTSSSRAGR